jgi:hypothetical protein
MIDKMTKADQYFVTPEQTPSPGESHSQSDHQNPEMPTDGFVSIQRNQFERLNPESATLVARGQTLLFNRKRSQSLFHHGKIERKPPRLRAAQSGASGVIPIQKQNMP